MTWFTDHWLDLLGWGGSALLVYSLLQSRILRLRVLNLVACVVLTVFNAVLAIWPMVAMNVALVAINAWFIVRLLRDRHDASAFEVLEVAGADEFLRHLLRVHSADVLRFNPDFVHDPAAEGDEAFLITKGDEAVGVVLLRVEGDTAHVLLDYVTPRFRDFSPGEFVWRRSGLLSNRGIRRVITRPGMVDPYYSRLGFEPHGDSWRLEVPPT